jgi:hypothetical protein
MHFRRIVPWFARYLQKYGGMSSSPELHFFHRRNHLSRGYTRQLVLEVTRKMRLHSTIVVGAELHCGATGKRCLVSSYRTAHRFENWYFNRANKLKKVLAASIW